jgi:putative ABC transport system permease protein
MFLDFFRLSLNSLRHRKRRSWLTIIGTLIGIMAVVSLVSIGQGLENSVSGELRELGGDKIFVMPGGGISGRFSDTTFQLTENDVSTVRNTRGMEGAVGLLQGNILAEYGEESKYIGFNGLPVTGEERDLARRFNDIEIQSGRYLRGSDTNALVVEEDFAEGTFEEELRIRSDIEINGTEFTVVGVFESSSSFGPREQVKMPIETARELLGRPDSFDVVLGQVGEGFEPTGVGEDVQRNLRNERGVEEGEETFNVRTAEDILRSFNNQLSIIRGVLLGIGSISLLVGGIGIMNTMYTAVTERTREIGVMKAVGATRRQILALFMIESGIVGMIGGLLGATVGIGLSFIAGAVIRNTVAIPFQPYISMELIAGSIFFSFIVGMISGVLPARKASKKEPVEALRSG